VNVERQCLAALGLERKARPVPSLAEYRANPRSVGSRTRVERPTRRKRLTYISDHEVIAALRAFGSDFERQLGELAALADSANLDRIKCEFADEWRRAEELAALKASRLTRTTLA
jgi:hypothetical protein